MSLLYKRPRLASAREAIIACSYPLLCVCVLTPLRFLSRVLGFLSDSWDRGICSLSLSFELTTWTNHLRYTSFATHQITNCPRPVVRLLIVRLGYE